MTEINLPNQDKELSDNLETKINKLNTKWNKTKEEYKHDILDIYETALSEGYTPTTAAKLCREKINIFSDKTIMRVLPDAATRIYPSTTHSIKNWTNVQSYASDMPKIKNQTRLVVPEEPTIPPPPEVVKEIEIIAPQEPAKTIADRQTFVLDPHTCKGWPDDKLEKYEIVCQGDKVVRVIML